MNEVYLPLSLASTPRTGWCYTNKFWIVEPSKGLVFIKVSLDGKYDYIPQYNDNEEIVKHLRDRLYPDYEVRQIPIVFLVAHGGFIGSTILDIL